MSTNPSYLPGTDLRQLVTRAVEECAPMEEVKSLLPTVVLTALLLASCASTTNEAVEQAQSTTPPATSTTTTTEAAVDSTTAASPTPTTSVLETPTVTEASPEPALQCAAITNFEDTDANAEWLVVNDNVMGGRSLGDRTFVDNTMVFAGSINLNGGGFSSLRLPLEANVLGTADRIVFRALGDGRSYMVTFDDSLDGRDRRISFRAPIEFENPGEWETVTVMLDALFPAAFGQPVVAEPFRPDLVTRMGIMLSDGVDGEFTLEVDSIEVCSPGAE